MNHRVRFPARRLPIVLPIVASQLDTYPGEIKSSQRTEYKSCAQEHFTGVSCLARRLGACCIFCFVFVESCLPRRQPSSDTKNGASDAKVAQPERHRASDAQRHKNSASDTISLQMRVGQGRPATQKTAPATQNPWRSKPRIPSDAKFNEIS